MSAPDLSSLGDLSDLPAELISELKGRKVSRARPSGQAEIKAILGALKLAAQAHPEIQYAGFEGSIAKRISGALRPREVIKNTSVCSHPARSGVHEEYVRQNGSTFCRACGEELGPANVEKS